MNSIILPGDKIETERELYDYLAGYFDYPVGYVTNYIAFRDVLRFDVERPLTIIWNDHANSKRMIGEKDFQSIVDLFNSIADEDREGGMQDTIVCILN